MASISASVQLPVQLEDELSYSIIICALPKGMPSALKLLEEAFFLKFFSQQGTDW